MTYVSEKYQLGFLTDYLAERGIDYSTEIEMYSIPIDVAGIDSNNVVTIEMKSRDVGRGLNQARRNLHYADYSYLSLWKDSISENVVDRLNHTDVGLLSVDESVEELSPAEQNEPHPYPRERLRELITNDV